MYAPEPGKIFKAEDTEMGTPKARPELTRVGDWVESMNHRLDALNATLDAKFRGLKPDDVPENPLKERSNGQDNGELINRLDRELGRTEDLIDLLFTQIDHIKV